MTKVDRGEVEARYQGIGLKTLFVEDPAGARYEPHRHAAVYLFTLGGSVRLRLDGANWQQVLPGIEIRIADNQLHEAVAGPEGWTYIFATTPEEMKRQGL